MPSDYNQQSYPTRAQPQLHVDNLCVTARLSGFRPSDPQHARVLEVGCGNGANLIPMAAAIPGGEFVGVDYASEPVASAREAIADLGLGNLRVHHADICELADDFGEFDYIIAHGFYSWVPDAAREALWRVARGSLSSNGILFVSYNVLPGWRQTAMLRDFLLLETRRCASAGQGPEAVWKAVELLASLQDSGNTLAQEAARCLHKGFQVAIHDEFQQETRPFLFREVLEAAAQSGFRYSGDAVRKARGGLQHTPQMAQWLQSAIQGNALLNEEYNDVLTLRRFRQSLFVRDAQEPDDLGLLERAGSLWIRSNLQMQETASDGTRLYQAPENDLRFTSDDPLLAMLCERLIAEPLRRLPLGDTLDTLSASLPPRSEAAHSECRQMLAELLAMGAFRLYTGPVATLSADAIHPAAYLTVAPLARWEAARNLPITSPDHDAFPLWDPFHRALLLLLDGSRPVMAISGLLASAVWKQKQTAAAHVELGGVMLPLLESSAFRNHPDALASAETLRQFVGMAALSELERLRTWGLLQGTQSQ